MTEIESRNVNFLEDEFPSIGEIKKDLELYEDLNSHTVTENGELVQGNELCLHIPTPVENKPEDVESQHA